MIDRRARWASTYGGRAVACRRLRFGHAVGLLVILGRRGGRALGRGPAVILLQQPVQDLHPRRRAHRPPLHLPVGVEPMIKVDICPAVRVHHRPIQLHVDRAHPGNVVVGRVGNVAGR